MSAFARGPGNSVLRAGPVISLLLPSCAGRSILEQDATVGERLANAIGVGEVTPLSRRLSFLDHPLDLLDRYRVRRPSVLGASQQHDAEHSVDLVNRPPHQLRIRRAHSAGV